MSWQLHSKIARIQVCITKSSLNWRRLQHDGLMHDTLESLKLRPVHPCPHCYSLNI